MSRLPRIGSDNDQWGRILNDFLEVSLNADGTLRLTAITAAGGYARPVKGIPATDLDVSSQTILSSVASRYVKPPNGIPLQDLSQAVQDMLSANDNAVQPDTVLSEDLSGTVAHPIVVGIQNRAIVGSPSNGQALTYNAANNTWSPTTINTSSPSDATASTMGVITLTNDLGGSAGAPTVVGINGMPIGGTVSSGQVLTANSSSSIGWSALPNDTVITANDQSGAYVVVLSDAGKSIDVTSTGATTVTVPPNSSVAFPIGTVIEIAQLGGGQITVTAGSGVTVNSPGSLVRTRVQYSAVSLRKLSTDTWILSGDLA